MLRLTAMMPSIFGVAGIGLTALGIHGLVSYTVRQSTHEIGIRQALGASASRIVRNFVGRGLRLGTIGARPVSRRFVTRPMASAHAPSLNLSTAVGLAVYETSRQRAAR